MNARGPSAKSTVLASSPMAAAARRIACGHQAREIPARGGEMLGPPAALAVDTSRKGKGGVDRFSWLAHVVDHPEVMGVLR